MTYSLRQIWPLHVWVCVYRHRWGTAQAQLLASLTVHHHHHAICKAHNISNSVVQLNLRYMAYSVHESHLRPSILRPALHLASSRFAAKRWMDGWIRSSRRHRIPSGSLYGGSGDESTAESCLDGGGDEGGERSERGRIRGCNLGGKGESVCVGGASRWRSIWSFLRSTTSA